ncbi:MAG: septum formation inhibitor Maf [Coriobacteriia bacterium]|nr:septum formation inhibitor Maf [Coriobacteriia bacterium]MBS5477091.1 septum formation inhibitor Maf [Coriobacteriia bacterium]
MILASSSPRRFQLLSEAGIDFRVVPSDYDESQLRSEPHTPEALVMQLARRKAFSVAESAAKKGEPVIGADTIVVVDENVLGKPRDEADARDMLFSLSNRTHEVMSAVCVVRDGEAIIGFTERTRVRFYDLSPAEIDAYIATGEPMDKAGAYGIQGLGRHLVRSIKGDYYTVVGLPIARLVRELRQQGLAGFPTTPLA